MAAPSGLNGATASKQYKQYNNLTNQTLFINQKNLLCGGIFFFLYSQWHVQVRYGRKRWLQVLLLTQAQRRP